MLHPSVHDHQASLIVLELRLRRLTGSIAGCRKKYIIERKEGEKVVARKQGITTSTCLIARPLIGDQSSPAPSQTCKQVSQCKASHLEHFVDRMKMQLNSLSAVLL